MESRTFQDHMLTLGRPLAISRIEDHFMWSATYLGRFGNKEICVHREKGIDVLESFAGIPSKPIALEMVQMNQAVNFVLC